MLKQVFMEYSIYHIENDLDCQVLKFGVEICVAKSNEDTVIHLIKGRHKLTFQSIENCHDEYSIIFEVPENGIEDFIDVQLAPIRNERKTREHRESEQEQARLADIEAKRRATELAAKQELERQQQIKMQEEKERAEREAKEEAKRFTTQRFRDRLSYALSLYRDFCKHDDKSSNGRVWIQDKNGMYYLSYNGARLTESKFIQVGRFSCGVANVVEKAGEHWNKHYYINTDGLQVLEDYVNCTAFYKGTALVSKRHGEVLRINTKGEVVRRYDSCTKLPNERHLHGLLFLCKKLQDNSYELRAVNQLTDEYVYSLRIQVHDHRLPFYSEVDYGYEKLLLKDSIKGLEYNRISWMGYGNGWIRLLMCGIGNKTININTSGRIILLDWKDKIKTTVDNGEVLTILRKEDGGDFLIDDSGEIIREYKLDDLSEKA